jgi:2-hydroxycyclohexanecarboxyl-CoA dehydrogenase
MDEATVAAVSRVAVVTGGGSGLGRAICEHLARADHRVAVLDRDIAHATDVADILRARGFTAAGIEADVSDRSSVEGAFQRVQEQLGNIGILVTSAAVTGFTPFEQITVSEWERTLSVNLTGTFHCMQLALPDMVAAGWGRIVTISSAAGQTGALRQGHYSASKGGVITLTKTVALEYAAKGITVNTIPPSPSTRPCSGRHSRRSCCRPARCWPGWCRPAVWACRTKWRRCAPSCAPMPRATSPARWSA